MRLLLIAYEFPPIESAQALRWAYLARELVANGHELHVLTVRLPSMPESRFETGATVHRVFAGPFVGWSSRLRSLLAGPSPQATSAPPSGPGLAERLYRQLRRVLDFLLFPDLRSEWLPFAGSAGRRLLSSMHFDLLLASHEPGVDLLLGLRFARRFSLPLICDLGDPVLAPYTPRWRRALHLKLERAVLQGSRSLLVTNAATAELLRERHGTDGSRFLVLSQGFDAGVACDAPASARSGARPLTLFYSGSLYRGMRSAASVFDALSRVEGVELTVAGDLGEEGLPDNVPVRFLGRLSHAEVLQWQRRSDVLLNIGNAGTVQVPGKLFEYFGACRPILHVASDPTDACSNLVLSLRRGLCASSDPDQLVAALRSLRQLKLDGTLESRFDLSLGAVDAFSWKRLGSTLSRHCRDVANGAGHAA